MDLYYLHAAEFVNSALALAISVLFAITFIVDGFTPFQTFTRFSWGHP